MAYTDIEQRILDMWPRFENGEYVWYGDVVNGVNAKSFVFVENGVMVTNLTSVPACGEFRSYGEPFKRPAPKVLDADGVEVKVDDTVWLKDGTELLVEEVNRYGARCFDGEIRRTLDPKSLTHTQPDSWERIEKDAESIRQIIAYNFGDFSPSDFKQSGDSLQDRVSDLIRRAKALAEKEAAR